MINNQKLWKTETKNEYGSLDKFIENGGKLKQILRPNREIKTQMENKSEPRLIKHYVLDQQIDNYYSKF